MKEKKEIYQPANDDIKKAGIYHVEQEFIILKDCYIRLSVGNLDDDDLRIILECFLLHVRCLYDFLTKSESEKDDIVAVHYIGERVLIDKEEVLIEKINKQLSHITYSRNEPTDLYEKIDQIYTAIFNGLKSYNNKVRESNFNIKSI